MQLCNQVSIHVAAAAGDLITALVHVTTERAPGGPAGQLSSHLKGSGEALARTIRASTPLPASRQASELRGPAGEAAGNRTWKSAQAPTGCITSTAASKGNSSLQGEVHFGNWVLHSVVGVRGCTNVSGAAAAPAAGRLQPSRVERGAPWGDFP